MLLGLLLAYGPISSTASLDHNILVNYASTSPVDRFATILPLLLPIAILIIPYTDLLLAVVRRMAAGQSPFDADRQHLHHRLQNMGHSHRQTVLLMYLWAALFSGAVVGLSVIRVPLIWLALATVGAVIALVLATMPKLRPWRSTGKRAAGTRSRHRIGVTPARSTGPIAAANGQAAAVLRPAPNGMPAVLSARASRRPTSRPTPPADGLAAGGQRARQRPARPWRSAPARQRPARPARPKRSAPARGRSGRTGRSGRAAPVRGAGGRATGPGRRPAAEPPRP